MEIDDYQKEAYKFALPRIRNLTYMVHGLCSEAGEVAGKISKIIRGDTILSPLALRDELGDVLWMAAGAATQLGLSLSDVAKSNIEKLQSRELRGKIQGDGDDR